MSENKSSISHVASYQEIGEYWDIHDLSEVWEQTEPVDFEVDLQFVRRKSPFGSWSKGDLRPTF